MMQKLVFLVNVSVIAEIVDMSPRYIRSLVKRLTDRLKIT